MRHKSAIKSDLYGIVAIFVKCVVFEKWPIFWVFQKFSKCFRRPIGKRLRKILKISKNFWKFFFRFLVNFEFFIEVKWHNKVKIFWKIGKNIFRKFFKNPGEFLKKCVKFGQYLQNYNSEQVFPLRHKSAIKSDLYGIVAIFVKCVVFEKWPIFWKFFQKFSKCFRRPIGKRLRKILKISKNFLKIFFRFFGQFWIFYW